MPDILLSIVAPVFNQGYVLNALRDRLHAALDTLGEPWELILVDDASEDPTRALLLELQRNHPAITLARLRRNAGQANAIAAGLTLAKGDFVAVMDADLQDRPEDLPPMLKQLRNSGADLILAQRPPNDADPWRNTASRAFYALSERLTDLPHSPNTGVFRIATRKLVDAALAQPLPPGTVLSRMRRLAIRTETHPTFRDAAPGSGYDMTKLLALATGRFIAHPRWPLRRIGAAGLIAFPCLLLLGLTCLAILTLILSLTLSDPRLPRRYVPKYEIGEIHAHN
jgi:polyisoprenyl-phosphate glycosyltransferase